MTASTNTNALVPYGVRPSDEVMETLASTVSKSTRAVYIRECVNFTTWLYDKDSDHFIHYEYLPSLRLAHESDEEQGLQKITRNLRSTISELVSEVNEAGRNCPIALQKISFNIFATTRAWNHPLDTPTNLYSWTMQTYSRQL